MNNSFSLTDHALGWVDSQLRLRPPLFASEDYNAGYMMGTRDRLREARVAIDALGALSMRDVEQLLNNEEC